MHCQFKLLLTFLFVLFVCLLGSQDLHAQTKNTPNFGCTFEDGLFKANILVSKKSLPEKKIGFTSDVYIQGCQVIQIIFDTIEQGYIAKFKPEDIEDSGNTIIEAEQGIRYEIQLILP
jgi:hypothetical protein